MSKRAEECPKCKFRFAWDGKRCDFCNPSRKPEDVAEERAFLDGMKAKPEDDFLPLVYADWLDEQDNLRGSLLRLAIEEAGLRPNTTAIAGLLAQADFFALRWYVEVKVLLRKARPKK